MKLAFAVGVNGEFSLNGGLPWGKPIKEDMHHYIEFTKDCVMVMGYKTWVSLPHKTKSKYAANGCYVLFTRKDETYSEFEDCNALYVENMYSCIKYFRERETRNKVEYCFIGGKYVIEQSLENLQMFDEVLYTVVDKEFPEDNYNYIDVDYTEKLNGMVGSAIYKYCLEDKEVTVITFEKPEVNY